MERAAAHVFVADGTDLADLQVADSDRHHLLRVLRLADGTRITVGDGLGTWRPCTLRADGRLDPAGDPRTDPVPGPPIGIAFTLTKGDRPEWTVQKLTELGVDVIVPMVSARSVVRPDAGRAAKAVERWRRVAREASSQSRRAWLPVIEDVSTFAAVAARPGAAVAQPGGGPPSLAHELVAVGPEGGWDGPELERAADLPTVGLGPLVVRSETAAVALGAILTALRSGVVAAATTTGPHDPRP